MAMFITIGLFVFVSLNLFIMAREQFKDIK